MRVHAFGWRRFGLLAGTGAVMVLTAAFAFGDADDPLSGSDTGSFSAEPPSRHRTRLSPRPPRICICTRWVSTMARQLITQPAQRAKFAIPSDWSLGSKYFVGSGHQRCDLWSEVVARIDFVDWRAKLPMTSANDSTVRQPCHPSSPTQLIVEPTRWDIRGAGKPVWSSRIRGLQSGAGSSWLTPAWAQTIESAS